MGAPTRCVKCGGPLNPNRKHKGANNCRECGQKLIDLVKKNKAEGLLCACNKARVPYGPPPGTLEADGILHGYDHCEPSTCP